MNRQRLADGAAEIWERELSREEFDRRLRATTAEEREANAELIDWFLRRYPTVASRLAYARRKYREAAARSAIVGARE